MPMEFIPAELIKKKRRGEAHSPEEIQWIVQAFTSGEMSDYQMAAWAMAVCFQGLSNDETAWLTAGMRDSGKKLSFSHLNAPRIDKHSTGGVGDKTSLIIGPILAAAQVYTPMIAGRGLGHTGGTLDKFESIPGFRVQLSQQEYTSHVEKHFFSIMGQTADICPADKKLYALRDVTGTIDSLPLICGSIMSKKLAEDLTGLVLDVKWGSGAFMKTQEDAEKLALLLKTTGEKNGLKVHAALTNMDRPLGRFAGNSVEVKECVDILRNELHEGYEDTRELSLILSAHALVLANKAADVAAGYTLAEKLLSSGAAWTAFENLLTYQGPARLEDLPWAENPHTVVADDTGTLAYMNTEQVGLATVELGAGRKKSTDPVDPRAGIEFLVRPGETVERGQPMFRLYSSNPGTYEKTQALLLRSLTWTENPPQNPLPLVAKVIT